MLRPSGRTVELMLHGTGALVGPFEVELPWWQEVEAVVTAARDHLGLDVVVLRLLEVDEERVGGRVRYLVEERSGDTQPDRDPQPLRLSWARPGGAQADVAWATAVLHDAGWGPVHTSVQVRTWNLSSIWRIDAGCGRAWLKVVPPFFAHEGPLVELLARRGHPVPSLIARDRARSVFAEAAGVDGYGATAHQRLALMRALIDVQIDVAPHTAELLAAGVPDWRAGLFAALADAVVTTRRDDLAGEDFDVLRALVGEIGDRFAHASSCGIPDSVTHGDAHPGNARFPADGGSWPLTILDWGDATIGSPLLDMDRMPEIREEWIAAWAAAIPGSDPAEGWRAVEPLAPLRNAVVYQRFLDQIEPTERVYHRYDVTSALRVAAALARLR